MVILDLAGLLSGASVTSGQLGIFVVVLSAREVVVNNGVVELVPSPSGWPAPGAALHCFPFVFDTWHVFFS